MAKNTKNTANKTANKTADKPANKNAATAVNAIVQPDAVTQLTALVNRLMAEITELKAQQAKPVEQVKTSQLKHADKPANKVPPANGFVLLAENESVNEIVTISAIGSPFWGKGFGGRSCMKQAVNCVTKTGNTIVVFLLLNRDAVGNTINSGLTGGASYVITGVASGKTWEFNNTKTNIVNKARFSPVS